MFPLFMGAFVDHLFWVPSSYSHVQQRGRGRGSNGIKLFLCHDLGANSFLED